MNKILIRISITCVALIIISLMVDMYNSSKNNWFQGTNEINTEIKSIANSLNQKGESFVGIIEHMPGMTSVKLIEEGNDFVTIETNEGMMKRTNIISVISPDKVILEFDEEYQAGKTMKSNSHFYHEYVQSSGVVIHKMTISKLKAPGFAGFFYRNFGSSNIGKAFLKAHKSFFETN